MNTESGSPGNITVFEASELPAEQFAKARLYLCYERHFFLLYACRAGLETFPLLFADRYLGWRYSHTGSEPLIAKRNGFLGFLDDHVWDTEPTEPVGIGEVLYRHFAIGQKISVAMDMQLSNGTPYVTAVLLEGMSPDRETIFYTKVNDAANHVQYPMPYPEFLAKVTPEEDGWIAVLGIKDAAPLHRLLAMTPAEAFRYVFGELYGYAWQGEKLTHRGEVVEPDASAFDELLAGLDDLRGEIFDPAGMPQRMQLRLNKHLENRFAPSQMCLRYVLGEPDLGSLLDEPLRARISAAADGLDAALLEIRKFASLLVQRPTEQALEWYRGAVQALAGLMNEYQAVNHEVARGLTRDPQEGTR